MKTLMTLAGLLNALLLAPLASAQPADCKPVATSSDVIRICVGTIVARLATRTVTTAGAAASTTLAYDVVTAGAATGAAVEIGAAAAVARAA